MWGVWGFGSVLRLSLSMRYLSCMVWRPPPENDTKRHNMVQVVLRFCCRNYINLWRCNRQKTSIKSKNFVELPNDIWGGSDVSASALVAASTNQSSTVVVEHTRVANELVIVVRRRKITASFVAANIILIAHGQWQLLSPSTRSQDFQTSKGAWVCLLWVPSSMGNTKANLGMKPQQYD